MGSRCSYKQKRPIEPLALHQVKTLRKATVHQSISQEADPQQRLGLRGPCMILDFPASGTRKNKWLLRSHGGYGILGTAAQTDEDRASLRPLSNLVFHCSHLPEPKTSTDFPGLSIQGHTLVLGNRQEGAQQNLFSSPSRALF